MNNISGCQSSYCNLRITRRRLIVLAALFVFSGACAQSNAQFYLQGEIKGLDSGKVYLYYRDDHNRGKLDSGLVKESHFSLKGSIAEPCIALITLKPLYNGPDKANLNSEDIYLEPTHMYLSVTVNRFKEIILKGSHTDEDRMKLRKLRAPVMAVIDPVQQRLRSGEDSLASRLILLYRERDAIDSLFMMQHLQSYFTANILLRKVQAGAIGLTYASALVDGFPERLKKSYVGTEISRRLAKVKLIPLGGEASNFVAISTTGDTISLRKYRGGKYVLLDFWASWCVPCRHVTPDLKQVYQRYKDRLEIIGISFDDKQADLEKAMAQDSIYWPQIMQNGQRVRIDPANKLISDSFLVDGFPFLLLIDKEGRIVEKFGSGVDAKPTYQIASEISKLLN